jgi:chromosome segregation ATPase
MVIFSKPNVSVYFQVNQSIRTELEKAIAQQQKNISSLSETEKACKKKIIYLNRMIQGNTLAEEKKHLLTNLKRYTEESSELQKEISSGRNQLKRFQETIQILEKEINSKQQRKFALGNALEERLRLDLKEQQKEEKRISSAQHHLKLHLKSLREEKKRDETELNNSLAELQKTYLQEKSNKEREIDQAEQKLNLWTKEKNTLLHQERKAILEAKEKISHLNQEREELSQNLEDIQRLSLTQLKAKNFIPGFLRRISPSNGERDLVRKEQEEFTSSKNAVAKLETEISECKQKEQKLLQDIEKKDQLFREIEAQEHKYILRKKILQELERDLTQVTRSAKTKKEGLGAIFSKISKDQDLLSKKERQKEDTSKEVKREISLLTSKYEKNLAAIQSNNSLLRKKIQELQEKRATFWKAIEKRSNDLNDTLNKINSLDNRILEVKRIDSRKTQALAEEIKKIEKGVFEKEHKIEKIHHMLYNLKGMSSDLPAVVGGFKKEESRVKENLLQLRKNLLEKKDEAASLKEKSATNYSNFLLQKNHLGLVQKKILLDKEELSKNLSEISRSLNSLKTQLEHETDKHDKVQSEEHQELLHKQNYLVREITHANQSIHALKKELEEETLQKKERLEDLHRLNEKKTALSSNVAKSKGILSETDRKIEEQKKYYAGLLEEELFRQRLIKKIKQDEIKEKNDFNLLQEELDSEAREEFLRLNKEVISGKSTTLRLGHRVEEDKKQFLSLLEKKKKEIMQEKRKLQEQLPLHKKSREEAIMNQGKARLAHIQQEIKQNAEKLELSHKKLEELHHTYETEANIKRKETFQKKAKIDLELQKLSHQDFSEKGSLKKLQDKVSSLNQKLNETGERVTHAKQRVERIEEIFTQNSSTNRELSKVIHDKLRLLTEQVILREELRQLRTITAGKEVSPELRSKINMLLPSQVNEKMEMSTFLKKVDNLLGRLPKKEIDHFSKTPTFKQYQKIMKKYGVK